MDDFKNLTIADFERLLERICDEQKRLVHQTLRAAATKDRHLGPLASEDHGATVAQQIMVIHQEWVDRAMDLVVQFLQSSAISLDLLTDRAKAILRKRADDYISSAFDSGPWNTRLAEAGLRRIAQQTERGLEDVKVGFVRGRAVMQQADTIQGKALRVLKYLYDHNNSAGSFLEEVAKSLQLSETDAGAAWNYLCDKAFIKPFNIPTAARITASGIEAVESAALTPNTPVPQFPSVTYNVTVHGTGTGSQFNVGSAGAQQTMQNNIGDTESLQKLAESISRIVEQIENQVPRSSLAEPTKQEFLALASELGRAGSDPKTVDTGRVKQVLTSLKSVAEGAGGDLFAAGILASLPMLFKLVGL